MSFSLVKSILRHRHPKPASAPATTPLPGPASPATPSPATEGEAGGGVGGGGAAGASVEDRGLEAELAHVRALIKQASREWQSLMASIDELRKTIKD